MSAIVRKSIVSALTVSAFIGSSRALRDKGSARAHPAVAQSRDGDETRRRLGQPPLMGQTGTFAASRARHVTPNPPVLRVQRSPRRLCSACCRRRALTARRPRGNQSFQLQNCAPVPARAWPDGHIYEGGRLGAARAASPARCGSKPPQVLLLRVRRKPAIEWTPVGAGLVRSRPCAARTPPACCRARSAPLTALSPRQVVLKVRRACALLSCASKGGQHSLASPAAA